MIIWLVISLLVIISFSVLIWKKNWKIFLLSLLPLVYALFDIYLECKATDSHSEACVWGYLTYIYSIVIGGIFYLIVTFFQVLISKILKSKNDKLTNVE